MILLDADVILLDKRYQSDPRFDVNREVLDRLYAGSRPVGITMQALLEVAGVARFGVQAHYLPDLALHLSREYKLRIVPSIRKQPQYAGCTFDEVSGFIAKRMALGDAVQAAQITKYIPIADVLLTWNATHFLDKLPISVQTPAKWLAAQTP